MNGITRMKYYHFLASRDGEKCKICGIGASFMQLVIDHIDNNNRNNDEKNVQLLCRRCNYLKNPRRPLDECESENENTNSFSELEKSNLKKPQFKKFVYHELNERNEVPEKELLDAAAEELDSSQVTLKRYLDGMCSERGICEKIWRVKTIIIRYKMEDSGI